MLNSTVATLARPGIAATGSGRGLRGLSVEGGCLRLGRLLLLADERLEVETAPPDPRL